MSVVAPPKYLAQINDAIEFYKSVQLDFAQCAKRLHDELTESPLLKPFIHSSKYRQKDVDICAIN